MSAEPVTETPVVEPTAVEPQTETTATDAAAPVAPAATEAPVEAPVATEAEPVAPVPATESKEEKVGEDTVKIEAQPVAEGVLGYKAPGLIKSLRFSKKYFWFGDEAVSENAIAAYLRTEKSDIAHKNAAHASETGKGLFLFAKRVEDKASPAGFLNLGEVTEVAKEETLDFSFKLHGHKHTFQASTKAERDGWLVAVQKASTEAKTASEGITTSDGYKNKLSKYSKPFGAVVAGGAAATTSKATAPKAEDKVHDGTTEGGTTAVVAAETPAPKTEKSRSQSRKRQSIFGTILGKKDQLEEKKEIKKEEKAEKKEIKKEEKAEKKEEKKEEKAEKKEEKKEEKAEKKEEKAEKKEEKKEEEAAAIATGAAAGTAVAAEESKPVVEETPAKTETTTASTSTPAPLKSKRGSVFGKFFSPSKKEEKKEDSPAVPPKDVAPVAAEAPQLDPVDAAAPIETPAATTETAAETTKEPIPFTDVTAGPATTATPTTPTPTSPKKEGGILGFFKAKEAAVESKIEEKKEEKAEKKEEEEVADKADPAAATTAETEAAAVPAAAVAASPEVATATTPTTAPKKDRRRSGFFDSMSSSRARKSETTSDAEGTDGEKKSKGGLGGLFRKVSRSAKPTTGPMTDSSAPPAISKDVDPIADSVPATEAAETTAPVSNGLTNGEETAAKPVEPVVDPVAAPETVATATTAAPVTASA